jgi:hypothetical protein
VFNEHQERLDRAADQISDLMGTSFIMLLAKGEEDSASPNYAAKGIEEKGETLTCIWNMMRGSPFMQAVGEARGNGERFIEEELKIKWGKPKNADSALLYYDYVRLDPESDSRQQGGPGRESMFREAIIKDGRRPGVTSIDEYLEHVRNYALLGVYRPFLSAIRKRWEYWHPSVEFFPPDYLDSQQKLRSDNPFLLRSITSALEDIGSFRRWRRAEKDVAEWEEAEKQRESRPEA